MKLPVPNRVSSCVRHATAAVCLLAALPASSALSLSYTLSIEPLLTTFADPALSVVSAPNAFLSGVVKLEIFRPGGNALCSGGLLGSGAHVLTAAHCVGGATGAAVTFAAAAGSPSVVVQGASAFQVHPGWTGSVENGADLAIIALGAPAPAAAVRYDILRDDSRRGGFDATLAGYGRSGSGTNGATLPPGTLRAGTNKFDTIWSQFPGNPFAFDFDDGSQARDAIGRLVSGLPQDLGSANEVMVAPGDSGGPSFIDGVIAGVHSFGATTGQPIDLLTGINANFGELGGDTRTAAYASWIDSVAPVPEPQTYAMLLAGLGLVSLARYRSVRR